MNKQTIFQINKKSQEINNFLNKQSYLWIKQILKGFIKRYKKDTPKVTNKQNYKIKVTYIKCY